VVVRPVVIGGGFYFPYRYYDPFYWDFWGWGPPVAPYPTGFYGAAYQQASAARIQVTPRNAEVYVDGFFAGVVDDFDGFSQRLRVAPGQHVIELYLDGYRSISQSILFQPGETHRVRYAMEPLPIGEPQPGCPQPAAAPAMPMAPPPAPADPLGLLVTPEPPRAPAGSISAQAGGILSVRVQPSDAAVLIDGERWEASGAAAPLVVQVTPGTHRVEVQKEGYLAFRQPFRSGPAKRRRSM